MHINKEGRERAGRCTGSEERGNAFVSGRLMVRDPRVSYDADSSLVNDYDNSTGSSGMPSRGNRAGRRPKAIQKEGHRLVHGRGTNPTCDRPQKLTNSGLGYRPVRCKPGPMIPFARFTCLPLPIPSLQSSSLFLSVNMRYKLSRTDPQSRNPRKYSDIIAEEGSVVKTHHLRDSDATILLQITTVVTMFIILDDD